MTELMEWPNLESFIFAKNSLKDFVAKIFVEGFTWTNGMENSEKAAN